jgi:hypothetical protein
MSESLLKTRAVFLDTEAYDHQKLRFDHPALRKLRELGGAGFLHIVSTDAVVGEVRRHISETLNNAAIALARFQGHAGVVQTSAAEEIGPLFKPVDHARLLALGQAVWDGFVKDAKVEVVSAATVHGANLLDLYFARQPPFSDKKKSEFPDAISLLSLEQWCRSKNSPLYLVGNDPDIKAWCESRRGVTATAGNVAGRNIVREALKPAAAGRDVVNEPTHERSRAQNLLVRMSR